MSSTAIVWLRRDLRVADNPQLSRALAEHQTVAPVFVFDDRLLHGRFSSATRVRFLLESLADLRASLRQLGGELYTRRGDPQVVLPELARELGASAAYWASDVSPFAVERDRNVRKALAADGVDVLAGSGLFIADVSAPRTKSGKPMAVFTPYWNTWDQLPRRSLCATPKSVVGPKELACGGLPSLEDLGLAGAVADTASGGEGAARAVLERFERDQLANYKRDHDRLAGGTSELSAHLHFGTISARELEELAVRFPGEGAEAFVRQLAWREFYAHVLLCNPANVKLEYQPKYRDLEWASDEKLLASWQQGQTGYPIVDAGMRQLLKSGWMHNRARMVVGSFLTKDLHLDWRHGEAHFMRHLTDGDVANNNGNWQWIASVGVDPAPYFRRIFNPRLQQERFDPEGEYVRQWVPELAAVPTKLLAEPWRMSSDEQVAAGCQIGVDYPEPIVDHAQERKVAMARYAACAT